MRVSDFAKMLYNHFYMVLGWIFASDFTSIFICSCLKSICVNEVFFSVSLQVWLMCDVDELCFHGNALYNTSCELAVLRGHWVLLKWTLFAQYDTLINFVTPSPTITINKFFTHGNSWSLHNLSLWISQESTTAKKINKISFLDTDFWNFLNQSIIIEIVSCYTCYMRKMN